MARKTDAGFSNTKLHLHSLWICEFSIAMWDHRKVRFIGGSPCKIIIQILTFGRAVGSQLMGHANHLSPGLKKMVILVGIYTGHMLKVWVTRCAFFLLMLQCFFCPGASGITNKMNQLAHRRGFWYLTNPKETWATKKTFLLLIVLVV